MDKTVVILAGGKGTRLYPYTVSLPKPLLPVGDKPILEIIIRQLSESGFRNVILAVNHQADIIMSCFGTGKKYGVDITYSVENEPLSTMAPLTLINNLPDEFLVMNGDVLTDLDFCKFFNKHSESDNNFSISAYNTIQESQFGVLELDDFNVVTDFHEKPKTNLVVSMGVYAMDQLALSLIPKRKNFGFDDLMRVGLERNLKIGAMIYEGYWRDLGTPEDYQKANEEIDDVSIWEKQ